MFNQLTASLEIDCKQGVFHCIRRGAAAELSSSPHVESHHIAQVGRWMADQSKVMNSAYLESHPSSATPAATCLAGARPASLSDTIDSFACVAGVGS
jgi:hypothetical protein